METKNFKPATRYLSILNNQRNNLFTKQYHENMVNSREKQGLLSQQLGDAFYRAYTNRPEIYRIHQFTLNLTGYFGKTKDPILFEFTYAYDPYEMKLNLRELKATMRDEFTKTYRIKSHPSRDLPTSAKVYEDLTTIKDDQKIENKAENHPSNTKRKTLSH